MGPPTSKQELLHLTINYLLDRYGRTYGISCVGWLMVVAPNHTLCMVCLWQGCHVPFLNGIRKTIGVGVYCIIHSITISLCS